MAFIKQLLAFLAISAISIIPSTSAISAQQPALFHGTSVIIVPGDDTSSLANSTVLAANFFCYMAEQGYFSFGWWVDPSISSNTSHCVPDSSRFHWYEFASRLSCDAEAGTCLYSTQNVAVREPHKATPLPRPHTRKLRYVIKPVDIGNREYGQTAVSWIDDGGVKVYGVGTRQILSTDETTKLECQKAMRTFRDVYEKKKPDLAIEVDWDLCNEGVTPPERVGPGLTTQASEHEGIQFGDL